MESPFLFLNRIFSNKHLFNSTTLINHWKHDSSNVSKLTEKCLVIFFPIGIQFWCSSAPLGRVHGKLLYGHQKIRPEWRAVGPACCTQTPQQVRLCGNNSANTWGHSREMLYVMSSYRQLPSRRLFSSRSPYRISLHLDFEVLLFVLPLTTHSFYNVRNMSQASFQPNCSIDYHSSKIVQSQWQWSSLL